MKLNKELFYKSFKRTNALDFLLDKLDNSETINRLSWYAYILVTIEIETADTFAPVKEAFYLKPESRRIAVLKQLYAGRKSIINPNGRLYYGRGYVQLTHIDNYIKMNKYIQEKFPEADIVSNPDSVCNAEYSWIVLEIGMVQGLYTGKKLADYLNDNGLDFYSARRIINGVDRASQIAGRADKYFNALEWIEQAKAENGIDRYVGEAKP